MKHLVKTEEKKCDKKIFFCDFGESESQKQSFGGLL